MLRSLAVIREQLTKTPNDISVMSELLSCLDSMPATALTVTDIESLKAFKEPLFNAMSALSNAEIFSMLDKVFDEARADRKRIDAKASALTTLLWFWHQYEASDFIQKIYEVRQTRTQREKLIVAFFEAIIANKPDVVRQYIKDAPFLLQDVFSLENNSDTGLLRAARCGHLDVVRVFLDGGANANKAKTNGVTALFLAAQEGRLDVVKELLAKGAAVDQARDIGTTPLLAAAHNGHVDVVKELLATDAAVNQANKAGESPLIFAVKEGRIDAAKVLLAAGAAVNQADKAGVTPFSKALQKKNEEMINCMLEATLKWLLQADVSEVTDKIAIELKPYKKQLFELIKKLPLAQEKEAVQKIFDTSKFDKKNMTTALGKVFCQGGASVDRVNSQLGSIYKECLDLNLIKSSNFFLNLFGGSKKEAPEMEVEKSTQESTVYSAIGDNKL